MKYPVSPPPPPHSVSLHGFYQRGRETLVAQVEGSLRSILQWALSGDLRHSVRSFAHLPPLLHLDAALGQSDTSAEGRASDLSERPRRGRGGP